MNVLNLIENTLKTQFNITFLQVKDESHRHAGHMEAAKAGGTHFNVVMVSDDFSGKNRVTRHKMVYQSLDDAFAHGLHALALKTYTAEEWIQKNKLP